jgi:hypothetical protein
MSYKPVQIYGDNLFRLAPDKCPLRQREVHQLTQRWQAPSRTQFALGEAPPDWPTMRITEIDPETEIDDVAYDIRLTAEGISDGSSFLDLGRQDSFTAEGWDQTQRRVYTAEHLDARWQRGAQITLPALTVAAEADDEQFSCTAHSLTGGMLGTLTFASGFGGCTSGTKYLVHRIDADKFRIADPANVLSFKVNTTTNTITTIERAGANAVLTGYAFSIVDKVHGLSNGAALFIPEINGGAGLSTGTTYYVISASGANLQLALTPGGSAVDITSAITGYSVLAPLVSLSSDGTGGTFTPVEKGMELMWVTDFSREHARAADYYEISLEMKGLNRNTSAGKHSAKRITATPQSVNVESFGSAEITSVPVWEGDNDEDLTRNATDHSYALTGKVSFDIPQVEEQLTYISRFPPPTWMLGSGMRWIPTDAPPVFVVGIFGETNTLHFPNGWKLGNLQSEKIPGQELYLTSVSLSWQRAIMPA